MLEKRKLADLLRRFVRGDVSPYELDDFLCIPAVDPEIEKIRLELGDLPNRFPPEIPAKFASEGGLKRIEEIAEQLEARG